MNKILKKTLALGLAACSVASLVQAGDIVIENKGEKGKYFAKKKYIPEPLPVYSEIKDKLPQPILADNKDYLDMYWFCWKILYTRMKQPPKGSALVSNFLDEQFSPQIFQWDSLFMIMFARYGHSVFPAIETFDNFYARQHNSGYICRELRESDGADLIYQGRWNTINPPLFSWTEMASYRLSGDKKRLALVLTALEKYAEWLEQPGTFKNASGKNWEKHGRVAQNSVHKLYWNSPLGSGMDNTYIGKATMTVDMSSQMVVQYEALAEICEVLGKTEKAALYRAKAKDIADRINKYCWNEKEGFYYDVDDQGNHVKIKSIRAFWTMLAGIPNKAQCDKLIAMHLRNPKEFWRKNVFPCLAATEYGYETTGNYWNGGVWAPTNYAVIKGLERCGYEDFATEATIKYLDSMSKVYRKDKTVYENYAPDFDRRGSQSKGDFVGWTGCGPIALLIENVLGFRTNGLKKELTWYVKRYDRHGIKNLQVGDASVDVVAGRRRKPRKLTFTAKASTPVTLIVKMDGKTKTFKLTEKAKRYKF